MRGHIRKRGNTWSVVVELGSDENGRRRQKWHSGFRTKKDASRALTGILARLQAGTYVEPSRQTVTEYLREWLPAIKSTVRPGTWSSYRLNMERHVIPRIGHVPLRQLGALHLNGLYADLLSTGRCRGDGGLSPRTVRYTHTILHRALRDAVRWGLLTQNPAALADPPKHRAPELQVWGVDEVRGFLHHARAQRFYALWLLLATTGLRRGEALGLRWEDLDLDAGRAAIRQTLSSVGGKVSFSTPKTAKSRRSVSLDPATVAALRAHRKAQLTERLAWGSSYEDHGLVFCRENGTPVRPDTLTRQFRDLANGAGLRPLRVHDLRHTYATIALGAGTHPKVVADRLGHATIAVTLDTYSHVVPALQEQTANELASLILGHEPSLTAAVGPIGIDQ
ncbi:MAG TPA: tyrosine-type recombinase/integrase [Acidimicrobiales bacterium]|nr:tyrosine-type recombinase/integrase [Acidimicrobiales bacterium]